MKSENNVFQEILVGLMGEIDKLEIKDEEVKLLGIKYIYTHYAHHVWAGNVCLKKI